MPCVAGLLRLEPYCVPGALSPPEPSYIPVSVSGELYNDNINMQGGKNLKRSNANMLQCTELCKVTSNCM